MTSRALALVIVLAACGETAQTTPADFNIDHPTDMTFACYGGLRLTGGGAEGRTHGQSRRRYATEQV